MEEQAHNLHTFDGGDLSAGLEELRLHIVGIEDERDTEVVRLSWVVMEISDALIDLGVFPIWDVPLLSKPAQEVLASASLILEHL
jgi:hypothetical protein